MKSKLMSKIGILVGNLALFAAVTAVTQACFWFFYQPETPKNIHTVKKIK